MRSNFVGGGSTRGVWVAETQRRVLGEEINDLTFAIIGAAMAVHRNLGPGFLERIYEEALVVELALRGFAVERQLRIPLHYKGALIGEHVLDMVVGGRIVLEIKSVETVHPVHSAQLHSYLTAGAFELGLLINFDVPVLEGRRKANHPSRRRRLMTHLCVSASLRQKEQQSGIAA